MQTLLRDNWKFIKEDVKEAYSGTYDDSQWRTGRVPHDYAIEGPFRPDNDRQVREVVADGIMKPIVHVGRTGGLPIADPAWYRRRFYISGNTRHAFLEFDGVMSNSTVYVNGVKCGGRIYGYSSFSVDISSAVRRGEENVVAVSLRPEPSSSRWYTGAGIYRNVRLEEKQEIYFPYCPIFVRTEIKHGCAYIDADIKVKNSSLPYEIHIGLYDMEGREVASEIKKSKNPDMYAVFQLKEFHRWHIRRGYLYRLKAAVYSEGILQDTCETTFGIRSITFDSNQGFVLNGERVKLQGVCMHHDLGALGAAFHRAAAERQLKKLMDIGINAYRCAHNPPDPQILDLCDQYGILVMDEAFDEWTISKVKNGYSKYFNECALADLSDMIHRDRNHPSVIMWSVGNEILEQREENGWKIARYLHQICKREDPTRPTTAGLSMTLDAFRTGLADEVDLAGINYKPHLYAQLHRDYPNAVLYGSENGSTVSSRGFFRQPAKIEHPVAAKEDFRESSYDLASPNWAYPIEREFLAQDQYEYVFGQFVWTGFDYLGEPTPYRNNWPARSSYFGIFDLSGMEKSRAYLFMSKWTDRAFIHLMPHWNWEAGQLIDVHAYTSFDEAELFLNGKSLGVRRKDPKDEIRSHRLIWEKVPYEPGELKAVASGVPDAVDIVKTAREPSAIELIPERLQMRGDGEDLVYVRCRIVDAAGTLCPLAETSLRFAVDGAGVYLAADNGNPASDRTFSEPYCTSFSGQCMVIIQSKPDSAGAARLTVTAEGLGTGTAVIDVMPQKAESTGKEPKRKEME